MPYQMKYLALAFVGIDKTRVRKRRHSSATVGRRHFDGS